MATANFTNLNLGPRGLSYQHEQSTPVLEAHWSTARSSDSELMRDDGNGRGVVSWRVAGQGRNGQEKGSIAQHSAGLHMIEKHGTKERRRLTCRCGY
jgi:hypothetical protein